MPTFVCIKKCFWSTLIEVGQKIETTEEKLEENCIREYFITQEQNQKEETEKQDIARTQLQEADKLRLELEEAGKPWDRRWGVNRLRNEVQALRSKQNRDEG